MGSTISLISRRLTGVNPDSPKALHPPGLSVFCPPIGCTCTHCWAVSVVAHHVMSRQLIRIFTSNYWIQYSAHSLKSRHFLLISFHSSTASLTTLYSLWVWFPLYLVRYLLNPLKALLFLGTNISISYSNNFVNYHFFTFHSSLASTKSAVTKLISCCRLKFLTTEYVASNTVFSKDFTLIGSPFLLWRCVGEKNS